MFTAALSLTLFSFFFSSPCFADELTFKDLMTPANQVAASFNHSLETPELISDLGASPTSTIVGTFEAGCTETSWFSPSATKYYVSSASTRRYYSNNTVVIDHTEYQSRTKDCIPGKASLFARFATTGTVTYKGASKLDPTVRLVTFTFKHSSVLIPKSSEGSALASVMNKQCPCGGIWTVGKQRDLDDEDCPTPAASAVVFCHFISGSPQYGVYKWVTPGTVYRVGGLSFDQNVGWSNPVSSLNRNLLPEGGNTNPEACQYFEWDSCRDGVQTAAKYCYSCQGLECDGCIYRSLPETDQEDGWTECCPCLWYYADQKPGALDFLKTKC
eukprot:m.8716 g.8716  ORF g.8716 m.8716 type:complete len:329 (+) comp7049_c0_seq1:710-1696(+)